MKDSKLCAVVVLLCVITPLAVGFVWPASEGTETIHEIMPGINITDDITNGDTQLYSDYNNFYRNNMFIYDIPGAELSPYVTPNIISSTPSAIPNTYSEQVTYTKTEYFSSKTFTINSFTTWCQSIATSEGVSGDYIMILTTATHDLNPDLSQGLTVTSTDGSHFGMSVQYNSFSGDITWFNIANVGTLTPADASVEIEAPYDIGGGFTPGNRSINVICYQVTDGFVDLTGGLNINLPSGEDALWSSNYDNIGFDVMIATQANMSITFEPYKYIPSSSVTVAVSGKQISLSGTGAAPVTLGSSDVYPYVLLSVDTSTGHCTLYGLAGIDQFGSWESAVRSQVSIDVDFTYYYSTPFSTISITDAQDVDLLFMSAVAGLITVPAIDDSTIDLKGYYDGDSQITISGVQQYPIGDCLYLEVNGSRIATGVADSSKNLTLFGKSYPLTGLIISVIGKDIYINGGEPAYTSTVAIQSFEVTFKDTWLATVSYSKMMDSEKATYAWGLINFGLDQAGFCMCGLLTASGSGIAAMLAGRRSGSKMALVSLTAICCAAVYLTLLMTA